MLKAEKEFEVLMMFCKYCGTQISDDSLFCEHCGKRLRDSDEIVPEVKEKNITEPAEQISSRPIAINAQQFSSDTSQISKNDQFKIVKVAIVVVIAILVLSFFKGCLMGSGQSLKLGNKPNGYYLETSGFFGIAEFKSDGTGAFYEDDYETEPLDYKITDKFTYKIGDDGNLYFTFTDNPDMTVIMSAWQWKYDKTADCINGTASESTVLMTKINKPTTLVQ